MKLFYTSFFLLISVLSFSQRNGTIKGTTYDSLAKRPVSDATITILSEKDSSLISFTMTDGDGKFDITDLAGGKYRMLVTHVGYHNSSSTFTISEENRNLELGKVFMNDRTQVLEGVTVRNEAPPVTLIGDTVQYNAGSFRTQPNASVEQLLKKLPGVEVERDGTVKAQGQKVNRVLVDGKEFFGTDPKLATKNLPADAIDKVQVYDRQSDQAQLTGFDDGNSEKTINLKLKKDKKKGVFGKLTGGAGTDERFEGRLNVNSFKGARQMSALAMGNNTNAEGFSFMDLMNFTGELGRMMRGGGGNLNISVDASDAGSMTSGLSGNNRGIRTIWGGGINYNNLIGTKTEMTSNYFYNHYNPRVESSAFRQYLLPDSSYLYNEQSLSDNQNNSHRLNLSFDYAIDSFHSLKISPSLGFQKSSNLTERTYLQSGSDGRISNDGYNNSLSESTGFNLRNDILFRKKFRKRGRTLSFSLQTTINDSEGESDLDAVNNFYDFSGAIARRDSINQKNFTNSDLRGYTAKAVYTEPVFKRSLLEFSIGQSKTNSNSDRTTYDYNAGNGKFDQFNDSLSNDFMNSYAYSNAGLQIRTQQKKYNYAIGLSVQQASLEGKVLSGIKDTIIDRTFTNILPNLRFQYNFSRYKNLTINYRSYTNQPSASQLQPVADISNPLNIKEGNPGLKQEYSHSVQINYMGVNPIKNRNIFAYFNLNRTDNKIVNSDSVFTNGVRKSRPVNTDGVYQLNGDINTSLPIKMLKGSFRVGTNMAYNRGRQFINGEGNNISTISFGPRITLDVNPTDKMDFSLGERVNYNKTKYSLQPAFNNSFFSQVYDAEFNWQLPFNFFLSTDLTYTINNQLAAGFNTSVPLLGASISKQFLRNNRGELKLRVNDILDQNIGINRSTNQNYIEDSRVNNLRRFALLSFTYSLSKTGQGGPQPGGINSITR